MDAIVQLKKKNWGISGDTEDRIKFTEKSKLARVKNPKPKWATVGNGEYGEGLGKKKQKQI